MAASFGHRAVVGVTGIVTQVVRLSGRDLRHFYKEQALAAMGRSYRDRWAA